MKFDRIRTDPDVLLGAPHIQGAYGPVSVAQVIDVAAVGLSRVGILNRMPGLSAEDLDQALRYAAEALRLGTFPPEQSVREEPGVRQLVLQEALWDRVTGWLRGFGLLVIGIPSGLLSEDDLPSYVVTPGPAVHMAAPRTAMDRGPVENIRAMAAALGVDDAVQDLEAMTLSWSQVVNLGGGTMTIELQIDARALSAVDMAWVIGLGRALQEMRELHGPRTT